MQSLKEKSTNVFNAKNVGSKTNRRHAQSKSINQDEIRKSKESNMTSRGDLVESKREAAVVRMRVETTRANIEASYALKN